MHDQLILSAMIGIQQYLEAHPESADTLDGIHYFWIQSSEIKEITQAALDLLLDARFVECVRYGRDGLIWRRARKTSDMPIATAE